MAYGYIGKILHVDLTQGSIEIEEPSDAFYRKFMGGSAMGMHYMNVGLLPDGDIDPSQPQVLMYVPSETGPKLAGFEDFMPLGPLGSPLPDPVPPRSIAGRAYL